MLIPKCSKLVNSCVILSGATCCANYTCMKQHMAGTITSTAACDVLAYNSKKSGPSDASLFIVAVSITNSMQIPFLRS